MKQKISYLLLLLSAVWTYGQVTLAVSDIKDQKVNQKFNLTVLLEISGENMEQQTPLQMPDLSKFEIIGSASAQNTVVLDAGKGTVVNQLVYQYVLSPKQAGRVKIGSVLVTVNGKIYKTEPFDIFIRENEKTSSVADNTDKNDLYLNLEFEDKAVYKNEPAIAVLRAYSRNFDNFRKVSNIKFGNQRHVNIKPVSLAKSEIESKSGLNSQIIGMFMIFPSETGKIEIDPMTANYALSSKANKISSNKVHLNVKKLPAGMPANFKNAVGDFTIEVNNKKPEEIAEVSKPVTIIVKVAGSGNFPNLHLPKILDSPDYTFYNPKISKETDSKRDGLAGFASAEYVVIPKVAGEIPIRFENFSYFNPSLKKYSDLGSKEVILQVRTPEQIASGRTALQKMNDYSNTVLETVNTPVLQTHTLKIKDKNAISWNIVFGNLALLTAFVSLLFLVMRRKERKKLKSEIPIAASLSIAETADLLRKDLTNHFEENIAYLKNLKDNKDFTKFFVAYDELRLEMKKKFSANSESEFRSILENVKGSQIAEEYRALSEKIQMEKFAPFHTEDHIEELYISIYQLFSEISK